MKRLLTATLFLLTLGSARALAVDVSVSGLVITGYNAPGSTAHVRVYYSDTINTSAGVTVPGDVAGGANFYARVSCTVASGVVTCPTFTIPSTTDSSKPAAKVTLVLYSAANARVKDLYTWSIPHTLGSSVTVQQLVTYNASAPRPLGDTFYTAAQVNTLITSATAGQPTSENAHTNVACSASPVFDIGSYSYFSLTLNCASAAPTVAGTPTAGRRITVAVTQDSTGGRSFTWPASFQDAPAVERRASATTTADFFWNGSVWRFVQNPDEAGGYALRCDGTANVQHGNYYPAAAAIGNYYVYEAWIRPDPDANGYFWSDGFGGSHAMLAGAFCSNGTCGVAGNVWDVVGTAQVSFSLAPGDYFPADKWTHVRVAGYGNSIITYVNGVPSGAATFSGTRGSPGGGQGSGNLYVCGSDHSMFKGYIAQSRFFEGWAPPQSAVAAFRPAMRLTGQLREEVASGQDVYHEANFFADYTKPGAIIPDHGKGFYGRTHPGVPFNNAGGSAGTNTGEERSVYPRAAWVYDPTLPFNRQGAQLPRPTLTSYTPPSAPAGAKIYDSFTRADQDYAFESVPTLGSTESGSLGPRAWSFGGSEYGIFAGRMVQLNTPLFALAHVASNSADDSAEVTLSSATTRQGAAWRIEDYNNNLFAAYILDGVTPSVLIGRHHAGVLQVVQIVATPATWTRIKGECNGTACAVYLDGSSTPLYSWTEGLRLTGTRYGVAGYSSTALGRVDDFTVRQ